MAIISGEIHADMRGVDVRTSDLCFMCLVGKWPDDGNKFLAIPNWSICVNRVFPDDIKYNSEEIFKALIKANNSLLTDVKEITEVSRKIAEAIEPYLKDGEKND